jgi:acylphosphatase
MTKQVRAIVFGRVQGVWYRGWTVDEAVARGLDGWVRNRRDGTVEAVFSGPAEAVDAMIAACAEGPPAAQVDAIETFDHTDPVESGFRQVPSA